MSTPRFVNPYNFISISSKDPKRSVGCSGTYRGVIDYSLLTKTPLFIPNTSNDDAFDKGVEEHKSYDFFSYNDLSDKERISEDEFFEPVIPGSEMRGMIRSNFEILTNSCLSAVDDDLLTKRTNEVFKAGLLKKIEKGKFELYKADDCLMRTMGANNLQDDWASDNEHYVRKCYVQDNLKEGSKVYFDYVSRTWEIDGKPDGKKDGNTKKKTVSAKPLALNISVSGSSDGKRIGYVLKGEDGPEMKDDKKKQQKHCCHVFCLASNANKPIKQLSEKEMNTLSVVLKQYKDNGEHEYLEYGEELKKFKNNDNAEFFPVYYSSFDNNNGYITLSPACITREVYQNTIAELLGKHAPCAQKDQLCPACRLFGTIIKDKKEVFHATSRVRFSDLHLDDEYLKKYTENPRDIYGEISTLKPLSTPKLSNTEFYLKQPKVEQAEEKQPLDAWFWTYDYYIDSNGIVHSVKATLNGRKFYWHNMACEMGSEVPDKSNTTIRPLKKDIVFKGKVYFDNVTKDELDQLIYIMDCGDSISSIDQKGHGYKLGHAKPLGLGSVALSVDSVVVNELEQDSEKREFYFINKKYEDYKEPTFEDGLVTGFKKMTDFYAVDGMCVSYPIPEEEDADGSRPVFKWFVGNHLGHKNGKTIDMPNARTQMVFVNHLEALEPELKPTGYQIVKDKDQSKKYTKTFTFEEGKQYRGTVVDYNEQKTMAFIKLDDGGRAQLFFRDVENAKYGQIDLTLKKNSTVNLQYLGKKEVNGKKYPNWKLLQ